jgi:D-alanyl-D-alanine carboxypeptidase
MLHSANDASVVIAEGVAGSVPNFAHQMNATARSLGATGSNFVTPNGLPMANHYTTAHDMALIMHAVLETPGMRDILSTRTAVIQPLTGSRRRIPLRSTNRMLWRDDLTIIGKTGWTREARHCFVGAGFGNGRQVIVAVLGSNDVWRDVETLVTAGLSEPPAGTGRPMWQEAALHDPPVDTVWSRSPAERELAEVVPPVNSRRAARLAALTPPTNAYGRRQPSGARARQAQGDAPEPATGKLRYAVHLGSFRSKARADEIRQSAAKRGYRGQVTNVGGAYRVSVPNFSSREAASRAARALGRALHVDPVVVAATQ